VALLLDNLRRRWCAPVYRLRKVSLWHKCPWLKVAVRTRRQGLLWHHGGCICSVGWMQTRWHSYFNCDMLRVSLNRGLGSSRAQLFIAGGLRNGLFEKGQWSGNKVWGASREVLVQGDIVWQIFQCRWELIRVGDLTRERRRLVRLSYPVMRVRPGASNMFLRVQPFSRSCSHLLSLSACTVASFLHGPELTCHLWR
jgi:hypothetical protein